MITTENALKIGFIGLGVWIGHEFDKTDKSSQQRPGMPRKMTSGFKGKIIGGVAGLVASSWLASTLGEALTGFVSLISPFGIDETPLDIDTPDTATKAFVQLAMAGFGIYLANKLANNPNFTWLQIRERYQRVLVIIVGMLIGSVAGALVYGILKDLLEELFTPAP